MGDVIKIVQSQDDQRESLSRERERARERGGDMFMVRGESEEVHPYLSFPH